MKHVFQPSSPHPQKITAGGLVIRRTRINVRLDVARGCNKNGIILFVFPPHTSINYIPSTEAVSNHSKITSRRESNQYTDNKPGKFCQHTYLWAAFSEKSMPRISVRQQSQNVSRDGGLVIRRTRINVRLDVARGCNKNGIIHSAFPPHTRHRLCPLDRGCFKPVKDNFQKRIKSIY